MKVEKSNLTIEDLIKGFDKPESQVSKLLDKFDKTIRVPSYTPPSYKIEFTSLDTSQPEDDYIINKLGLNKIIKILEIHHWEPISNEKIQASNIPVTENKNLTIEKLSAIIRIQEKELEKRSNAKPAQIVSLIGIILSIIFYFISQLGNGISLFGYHFIILTIFFSITFLLSYLTKSYKDGNSKDSY